VKTIFTFSFPDIIKAQICSPSYSAPRYVSAILEGSTALLFRENQKHGTDGRMNGRGTTFSEAPMKGRIMRHDQGVYTAVSQACNNDLLSL